MITSSYPGRIKSPHVVTCHTVSHWEDLPKFQFWGGGGYSETEKSQSAKICLNFNFFWGGGGRGVYSATEKSQSAKICLNFNFFWGGRVFYN